MWCLYILSWLALVVQLLFLTVAVASGLYYLAELVEEYTVASKKVILWMTLASLGIYLCLIVFEEFPLLLMIVGILSQFSHLLILKTFPFVVISSPAFITGVILFFINHYLAISYFNATYYSFSEVMAFFTLCLWLVPFALFVSLSANENVLPTIAESRASLGDNDVVSNYFSQKGKKYGLLSFFQYAKETILPQRNKKTF